jgi:hypothetical protein
MNFRIKSYLLVTFVCLTILTQPAFGETEFQNPFLNFDPSPEQMAALQDVFDEYSAMQLKLRGETEVKLAELRLELMKKDRFDSKEKEKASESKVNKLVREIGRLFGDSFENNVIYYLKAKDVLTEKQCFLAFSNLQNFNFEMPEDMFGVVEKELLNLNLDLTDDQVKKILKNRAEMSKNEIDLDLKRSIMLIDLQREMIKQACDNEKINKMILKITELGSKQLDNRVVHFIKAKDILTLDQKKKLIQAMFMAPGY